MINKDELVDYNKKIEYEDLSKEELVKLIKLQDTFNEVHNEILNLKDKVIDLMAEYIYEHDISTTGLYEWRDNEQIKRCFYKEVEEKNEWKY